MENFQIAWELHLGVVLLLNFISAISTNVYVYTCVCKTRLILDVIPGVLIGSGATQASGSQAAESRLLSVS